MFRLAPALEVSVSSPDPCSHENFGLGLGLGLEGRGLVNVADKYFRWNIRMSDIPVSMYVRGAEREAVMHQWRVDGDSSLGVVQQFMQIKQMSLAAPHAVPGTVLVQHEHLTWVEPALHTQQLHRHPQK